MAFAKRPSNFLFSRKKVDSVGMFEAIRFQRRERITDKVHPVKRGEDREQINHSQEDRGFKGK